MRLYPSKIGVLEEDKRHQESMSTEEGPRGATARQLSASRGERLRQKQTPLAPWSWTSSPQNCNQIHFCHLNLPVCAIVFGSLSKLIHWTMAVFRSSLSGSGDSGTMSSDPSFSADATSDCAHTSFPSRAWGGGPDPTVLLSAYLGSKYLWQVLFLC